MNIITSIKTLRHKLYLTKFRNMPIENNKIVFFSNNAMSYSCNPKYLTEYLIKMYPKKYKIVWVISNEITIPDSIPKNVFVVRYFSIDFLKETSTAKFIICNTRIPPWFMFKKRKGQYYIQTWHGSLALKVIEQDAADYLDDDYIYYAKKDTAQIDMIPASSRTSADQFRNGFWYNGTVMECGTPRCDMFFDDLSYQKFKNKYNISDEYKILLYAPTFRNNKKPNIYGIDFEKIKKLLEEKTSCKWKIIFKLHPNLSNLDYKTNDKDIINMDSQADLQELIYVSDILITDYSSCMFDMGLMKKECILYVPDLEEYIENERKLYFDIEKLPFPTCRNNEELISALINFSDNEYQNNLKNFYNKIGNYEIGKACEIIEKYISEKCFGE